MIEQRYRLPRLDLGALRADDFEEAFVELYGIHHLRPSYTAWLFFSARLPARVTPQSRGYAGTFALFGHAECWGSPGHCHGPDGLRRFDTRPSHPMTPAFKRVPVTQALKRHLHAGKSTLDIQIYAYTREAWPDRGDKSLVCCSGVQLVTL
ncbi:hypothetical protein [Halomonas sp. DN3]|uniref:hypothetical protein n=1 Tax=Halomonas sp. DN3 TaxID=2953657 RepID=UPI00209E0F0A|nr:hypothetical protein [Halomonas sp. DN3]USZ48757.1 hypothetical protein NKF27_14765 [Halomonas sp. DN3]